ncbi:alkaline phosphatase family protein [Rhodanobacter sp. 115]|uniref:alkaline phosphatase family protein n=1 Tax=Rhodanobacter sp. FW021-MT20 TaxID=1162282 RepID=UPI00192BFDD5|nr:alkaline phosphatase family protein [Rhodanobacter sp. 115]
MVILMQENRSFDHYFGTLRGVRGFSDPRPLLFPDGRPVWYQPNASITTPKYNACGVPADADYVLPFHVDTSENGDHQRSTDHSWSTGHLSWNHGKYDQWITQKQDVLTMGYLRREDAAFHRMRWPMPSPSATAISVRYLPTRRSTVSTCGRERVTRTT